MLSKHGEQQALRSMCSFMWCSGDVLACLGQNKLKVHITCCDPSKKEGSQKSCTSSAMSRQWPNDNSRRCKTKSGSCPRAFVRSAASSPNWCSCRSQYAFVMCPFAVVSTASSEPPKRHIYSAGVVLSGLLSRHFLCLVMATMFPVLVWKIKVFASDS